MYFNTNLIFKAKFIKDNLSYTVSLKITQNWKRVSKTIFKTMQTCEFSGDA